MNAKWIAELARGLTHIRGGAIYALIACIALALALYSCSQPQPTPQPPTPTTVVATHVLTAPTPTPISSRPTQSPIAATPQPPTQATPTAQPSTKSRPTQSPTPAASTSPQPTSPPIEPTPTPTPVPNFAPMPADAQFTQIAAGKHHACGLQTDGTALCWGLNFRGSLVIPGGNPSFTRISAGNNFTCALRIDGAIACWGSNNHAKASPPNGSFDEIAAGRGHACALDDGALTCWGAGFPEGAETIQEIPLLSAIQAGAEFTCGLTPNADMACLDNFSREITTTPGPFTSIGIGLHHVCAIKVNGRVFCVLKSGADDATRRSQPPPTKFVQIAGGLHHTCGITETSDIECWGSGEPGAPGERLSAPVGKFTTLAIGWRNSCALSPDGYASCWHQNDIDGLARLQHNDRLSKTFGEIKFDWPVELLNLPNGDLAVVEREGFIAAYSDEPSAAHPKTILDLTDKTVCCQGESGMFSAALDPQFEKIPFLYVYYRTVSERAYGENMPGLTGRLARFRVDGGKAVKNSELTILEAPQPREWHHGGAIRFGADGMLYLGIGDNSLPDNAQSLDSLLGKIIRIDIRGATPERPYRIPPDNPFVNNPDALPEIWAYGLRNPWRMDFAPDGRIFVADVGEYKQEEISLAAAGANLGWPLCEGNFCEESEADADGLTAPLFTYGRENGCAIIGGVTAPRLNNGFLFGDHCKKQVWLLEQDEQEGWNARIVSQTEGLILSFGMDADGTVYVLTRRNPIMRLQIDAKD